MTRMYRFPMPFHGRFVDSINDGTKDVTRRFTPRHIDTHLRAKVPNGKKLPSQWPGFANLVVMDCHSEMLHAIKSPLRNIGLPSPMMGMEIELKREGYEPSTSGLNEFIKIWDIMYAKHPERMWDANPPVWRIEFKNEDLGQRTL